MPFEILRRAWYTIWAVFISTSPTAYKHRPLQDANSNIRLLTLRNATGKSQGPIEGAMEEVSTDKLGQHDYVALSYTWGKPVHGYEVRLHSSYILINGSHMAISRNLEDFLRSKTAQECIEKRRPLFIDAVCIDQTSNEEKECQLPLMSQIYENARQTVVWLGQNDSSRQLRRVNTGLGQGFLGLQSKILCQVINNSYWERMWVVAELFLSSKVDVCIGDETISWPRITRVVEWQEAEKGDALKMIADAQRLGMDGREEVSRRLEAMIQTIEAKTKWDKEIYPDGQPDIKSRTTLLELMQKFHDRQCADDRDRVYALLPLVPDCQIAVNYEPSQSIFDLFCQVVEHVFFDIEQNLTYPSEPELGDIAHFLLHFWSLSQSDCRRASRLLDQKRETLLSERKVARRFKIRSLWERVLGWEKR